MTNFSDKWDKDEESIFGRSKIKDSPTKPQNETQCEHKSGVMIPQRNIIGEWVEPEYWMCDNCRLIIDKTGKIKPWWKFW